LSVVRFGTISGGLRLMASDR